MKLSIGDERPLSSAKMGDDELLPAKALTYDAPLYYWQGEVFIPKIFDAGPHENVPSEFNSVRISLDGTSKSDLKWDTMLSAADKYAVEGLKILWDLDLGLFSRLNAPLGDSAQREALRLAILHFCDTVWPRFSDVTLGLVIYRGSADFSRFFPWDLDQQDTFFRGNAPQTPEHMRLFCRDQSAQFLANLTAGLPGDLHPYLLMDISSISDATHALQLLHRDYWDRFIIATKGGAITSGLGWDSARSPLGYLGRQIFALPPLEQHKIGICLPAKGSAFQAVQLLQDRSTPFRILTETYLTADWDGLDMIVVVSDAIGIETKRKLRGFCAAGGCVVVEGSPIGLPNEIQLCDLPISYEST